MPGRARLGLARQGTARLGIFNYQKNYRFGKEKDVCKRLSLQQNQGCRIYRVKHRLAGQPAYLGTAERQAVLGVVQQ